MVKQTVLAIALGALVFGVCLVINAMNRKLIGDPKQWRDKRFRPREVDTGDRASQQLVSRSWVLLAQFLVGIAILILILRACYPKAR